MPSLNSVGAAHCTQGMFWESDLQVLKAWIAAARLKPFN